MKVNSPYDEVKTLKNEMSKLINDISTADKINEITNSIEEFYIPSAKDGFYEMTSTFENSDYYSLLGQVMNYAMPYLNIDFDNSHDTILTVYTEFYVAAYGTDQINSMKPLNILVV